MRSWRIAFATCLLCLSFTAVFGSSDFLASLKVHDPHGLHKTTPSGKSAGPDDIPSTRPNSDGNSIDSQAYAGLYHYDESAPSEADSKRLVKRVWSPDEVDQKVKELEEETENTHGSYEARKQGLLNRKPSADPDALRVYAQNVDASKNNQLRMTQSRKAILESVAKKLEQAGRSHEAARLRFAVKGFTKAWGRHRRLPHAWLRKHDRYKATGQWLDHRQRQRQSHQAGRKPPAASGESSRSAPETHNDKEDSRSSLFSEKSHSPVSMPQHEHGEEDSPRSTSRSTGGDSKRLLKRVLSSTDVDRYIRHLVEQTRQVNKEYENWKKEIMSIRPGGDTDDADLQQHAEHLSARLERMRHKSISRKNGINTIAKVLDQAGQSHDADRLRFTLKGFQKAWGRYRKLPHAWLKKHEEYKATGRWPEGTRRQGGRSTPSAHSDQEGSIHSVSLFSEKSYSPATPPGEQHQEETSPRSPSTSRDTSPAPHLRRRQDDLPRLSKRVLTPQQVRERIETAHEATRRVKDGHSLFEMLYGERAQPQSQPQLGPGRGPRVGMGIGGLEKKLMADQLVHMTAARGEETMAMNRETREGVSALLLSLSFLLLLPNDACRRNQ